MFRFVLFFVSLSLAYSSLAFANCIPPQCAPAPIPLPHIVPPHQPTYPNQGVLSATLLPGSIKTNVERIAAQYGWPHVVWNDAYDYNWVGETEIRANSFSGLLSQILRNYPLQAVLYHGNHILAIYPRVLK